MKKYIVPHVVMLTIVIVGSVFAASYTLTYTAQQDTDIQTKLIPMVNRAKCTLYGLPTTCTTANLQAPGKCVTKTVCQAAGLKAGSAACTRWSTEFTDSCTIYAANATGQAAYLKEIANGDIAEAYFLATGFTVTDFCTQWDLMTPSVQDTTCTTASPGGLGLPVNCRPCPEKP